MKTTRQREAAYDDLKTFARIHILLLQLSGLMTMGHGRGYRLARNLLSVFSHLNHFFLSIIYVISVATGQYDAVNIGECVGVVCAHWRCIILYCQRNHLADLIFDWDNVQILDREHNYNKRLISEMLFINFYDNTLNKMDDIQCLSKTYNNLRF